MDPLNSAPAFPPQTPYGSYATANRLAGPAKVLGVLFAVISAMSLLGGISLLALGGVLRQRADSPDTGLGAPSSTLFLGLAVFILLIAILHAATAYGLLARMSWGRVLLIITSILSLLSIPFGTILGAFALYYFLREGAEQDYARLTLQNA